ncbi:MAG: hypothetical protein JWL80_468 [Parcubacteria group bacterium]|nr:hypothetical protein [Parcubacteria group bacterium]
MSVKLTFQYGGNEYVVKIKPEDLGFEMKEGEQLHARASLEVVSKDLLAEETTADRLTIINSIQAELSIL